MTAESALPAAGSARRLGVSRLLLATGALLVEYLDVGLRFDGTVLAQLPDWRSHLANVGMVAQLAATVATALLVLDGPALAQRVVRMQAAIGPIHYGWLATHVLSFGLFSWLSARVFSVDPSAERAIFLATAWLVSGGACVYSLLLGLFGSAVRRHLAGAFGLLWLATPVAFGAWRLSYESWHHWSELTRSTLLLSATLLRVFVDQVHVDVASRLLVVKDFEVLIESPCSGIEGMVLLGVFSSAYVWRFRKQLRFPHALSLVPFAIAAAWLTNIARIATLGAIGAYWSPAVAVGGFHSKAGWLAFCALALAVVMLGQRLYALPPSAAEKEAESDNPTAVYCLPFVLLLAVGMVTTALSASIDFAYAARLVAATTVLWVFRAQYLPLLQRPSWVAALVGAAVFVMWWFAHAAPDDPHNAEVAATLRDMPQPLAALWIAARFTGSALIVPIAEELAFRGFLMRRLVAADFEGISFRSFSLPAWLVSSLAFGCLHGEWVAGTIAGAAYAGVVIWRGRLIEAVVAHACTNALLSLSVVVTGRWDLW